MRGEVRVFSISGNLQCRRRTRAGVVPAPEIRPGREETMSTHSPRRIIVVAVLCAVLAVAALPAQPLPVGAGSAAVPSLDNLLARLWSYVDALFEKEGASLEPGGSESTPPAPGQGGDAGVSIDPDGIHEAGGEGVITDPNG